MLKNGPDLANTKKPGRAGLLNSMHLNFCTFEIAILVNVPGHYLRRYGILLKIF